jgi:hypothetical protein
VVWVSTFSNPESLKTCTAFSWIPSMLKWADVQKPAKGGDNQGAIYLWARLVEDSASEPRAGSTAEAAALAGSSVAFALRSGYAPSVTRVSNLLLRACYDYKLSYNLYVLGAK